MAGKYVGADGLVVLECDLDDLSPQLYEPLAEAMEAAWKPLAPGRHELRIGAPHDRDGAAHVREAIPGALLEPPAVPDPGRRGPGPASLER